MMLQLTILAGSVDSESFWARELKQVLSGIEDLQIKSGEAHLHTAQILFVDADHPELDRVLGQFDRMAKAVFLIVKEGALSSGLSGSLPAPLIDGRVDDVIVYPFRKVEALGKLRHFEQILMWHEVSKVNASVTEVIDSLRADLKLAERLQKRKLPVRFPEIKGAKVANRYLAGMRSGGDHFDLAESKDGNQLSLILSDSSSYGLSSAVLSALMRVTLKLSSEEARSSQDTVRRIYDELVTLLGEKDRLSMFYGVLSRRDYCLRYLNLGSSAAFHAPKVGSFRPLPTQGEAIGKAQGFKPGVEGTLPLSPDDRLVLVSDGFVEAAGGTQSVVELLNRFRATEPTDLLNEFVFCVKSKFIEKDDMPEQDCTAVVLDVDSKVIRLAT